MLRFGVGDTDMNRTKGTRCKAHVYGNVLAHLRPLFLGSQGILQRVDDLELNVKE